MKKISFLLLAFALVSCSTTPLKPLRPETPEVFPAGLYEHDIEVKAITPQGPKDFSFSGIVQKSPEKIVVIGLAYGFTAFKLTDDLNGTLKKEISMESFKKLEPFVDKVYGPLKSIMTLEDPNKNPQVKNVTKNSAGEIQSFDLVGYEVPAQVHFSKPDEFRIPKEIRLESTQFTLLIKQTNYKLKKP